MKKALIICLSLIVLVGGIFFAREVYFAVFYPKCYLTEAKTFSKKYDLDTALVMSVINTESHFKAEAISRAGAMGLMQLMPSTAAWLAGTMPAFEYNVEKLKDPAVNIELGCYYLRYLFDKFEDTDLVLAAYNAGEGTVRNWLSKEEYSDGKTLTKIPYPETANYLKKVNKSLKVYKSRL